MATALAMIHPGNIDSCMIVLLLIRQRSKKTAWLRKPSPRPQGPHISCPSCHYPAILSYQWFGGFSVGARPCGESWQAHSSK
jgi:hypothetical protein